MVFRHWISKWKAGIILRLYLIPFMVLIATDKKKHLVDTISGCHFKIISLIPESKILFDNLYYLETIKSLTATMVRFEKNILLESTW